MSNYAQRFKTTEQRFAEKVSKSNGCWTWIGAINSAGYGAFYFSGKVIPAHRAAWLIFVGDIPNYDDYFGTCVLHKCDNPKCVNPNHLFLGTHQDNMTDKKIKQRTHRPNGCKNGRAKINENDVIVIRSQHKRGRSIQSIARQYGMDWTTIRDITTNKLWSHV